MCQNVIFRGLLFSQVNMDSSRPTNHVTIFRHPVSLSNNDDLEMAIIIKRITPIIINELSGKIFVASDS